MNDFHLFQAAQSISMKSSYTGSSKAHLGCVVVYKRTILANGYNSNKTHPMQAKYNRLRYKNDSRYLPPKVHAEIAALSKIKYLDIDFSKVHLYIYRELKGGTKALARPCAACLSAIKEMGIKHIHYTTYDGYAYEKLD